ncbi:MAG: porin family protein, partial [Acidobacteriota bacterium]|nr:porin family protein [Acidobacteriota bacterium]
MKKLLGVILAASFLLLVAAPAPSEAGIKFGLRLGGNTAKLTGDDIQDIEETIKSKTGLVAGVFLAINLGKIVTIQPEVLYTMKGTKLEDSLGEYSGKLYGDYLEIPLLLKIRIPTPGIQPAIFAGPSVGFKLREKLTFD